MTDFDLGPRLGNDPLDVLRYVLDLAPRGLALEFGVASGRSLRLIAAFMPAVGFDSFEGLPEDWRPGFPAGMFAGPVPDIVGASIMVGRFENTLVNWEPALPVGLVHIDCDLYSSTATVLEHVGPLLEPGAFVVFDEFHSYPGCEDHEQKAWREFVEAHDVAYDVIGHGVEQWAVRIR